MDFGQYSTKFSQDLLSFNDINPLTEEQKTLISKSYETIKWLSTNGIKFEPIYKRQSFQKIRMFFGGVNLLLKMKV